MVDDILTEDAPSRPVPVDPERKSARSLLIRRLADIVVLPSSQVSPQERWMVADVLDEMMRSAEPKLRARIAERMADQAEAPAGLLRRLAMDSADIAEPILRRSLSLTDFDIMEIAEKGDLKHRMTLARRETIRETVAAALTASGDVSVIELLLRNQGAHFAPQTLDLLVRTAGDTPQLARLLIKRPELRPAQAFTLFWDVDHDMRRMILERFAVGRSILQDAAEDVFPMLREETEPDEVVERALGYIDRRQRNRPANDTSQMGGLEGIVEKSIKGGFTEDMIEETARVSNVPASLFQQMLEDLGGEALAVFSKATGLSRRHLHYLIQGAGLSAESVAAQNTELVFDILSVDKSQTVLRYWSWSASARSS